MYDITSMTGPILSHNVGRAFGRDQIIDPQDASPSKNVNHITLMNYLLCILVHAAFSYLK